MSRSTWANPDLISLLENASMRSDVFEDEVTAREVVLASVSAFFALAYQVLLKGSIHRAAWFRALLSAAQLLDRFKLTVLVCGFEILVYPSLPVDHPRIASVFTFRPAYPLDSARTFFWLFFAYMLVVAGVVLLIAIGEARFERQEAILSFFRGYANASLSLLYSPMMFSALPMMACDSYRAGGTMLFFPDEACPTSYPSFWLALVVVCTAISSMHLYAFLRIDLHRTQGSLFSQNWSRLDVVLTAALSACMLKSVFLRAYPAAFAAVQAFASAGVLAGTLYYLPYRRTAVNLASAAWAGANLGLSAAPAFLPHLDAPLYASAYAALAACGAAGGAIAARARLSRVASRLPPAEDEEAGEGEGEGYAGRAAPEPFERLADVDIALRLLEAREGGYDAVEPLFRTALRQWPDDPTLLCTAAAAYFAAGNGPLATAYLRRCPAPPPPPTPSPPTPPLLSPLRLPFSPLRLPLPLPHPAPTPVSPSLPLLHPSSVFTPPLPLPLPPPFPPPLSLPLPSPSRLSYPTPLPRFTPLTPLTPPSPPEMLPRFPHARRAAHTRGAAVDVLFAMYALDRMRKEHQTDRGEENTDVASQLAAAQVYEGRTRARIRHFWDLILRSDVDVALIPDAVAAVERTKARAEHVYVALAKQYPNVARVHSHFSSFLIEFKQDYDGALKALHRAERAEELHRRRAEEAAAEREAAAKARLRTQRAGGAGAPGGPGNSRRGPGARPRTAGAATGSASDVERGSPVPAHGPEQRRGDTRPASSPRRAVQPTAAVAIDVYPPPAKPSADPRARAHAHASSEPETPTTTSITAAAGLGSLASALAGAPAARPSLSPRRLGPPSRRNSLAESTNAGPGSGAGQQQQQQQPGRRGSLASLAVLTDRALIHSAPLSQRDALSSFTIDRHNIRDVIRRKFYRERIFGNRPRSHVRLVVLSVVAALALAAAAAALYSAAHSLLAPYPSALRRAVDGVGALRESVARVALAARLAQLPPLPASSMSLPPPRSELSLRSAALSAAVEDMYHSGDVPSDEARRLWEAPVVPVLEYDADWAEPAAKESVPLVDALERYARSGAEAAEPSTPLVAGSTPFRFVVDNAGPALLPALSALSEAYVAALRRGSERALAAAAAAYGASPLVVLAAGVAFALLLRQSLSEKRSAVLLFFEIPPSVVRQLREAAGAGRSRGARAREESRLARRASDGVVVGIGRGRRRRRSQAGESEPLTRGALAGSDQSELDESVSRDGRTDEELEEVLYDVDRDTYEIHQVKKQRTLLRVSLRAAAFAIAALALPTAAFVTALSAFRLGRSAVGTCAALRALAGGVPEAVLAAQEALVYPDSPASAAALAAAGAALEAAHAAVRFGAPGVGPLPPGSAARRLAHDSGLDSALFDFVRDLKSVLRYPPAARSPSVPEYPSLLLAASSSNATSSSLYPLAAGLAEAVATDAAAAQESALRSAGLQLALSAPVLLLAFVLLLWPALRTLRLEHERTTAMLLMIPMEVVDSVEAIKEFLATGRTRDVRQQLRENTEQTKSILQAADDAIIVADHQGLITVFNGAAERAFGCPHSEAEGRPLTDFLPSFPAPSWGDAASSSSAAAATAPASSSSLRRRASAASSAGGASASASNAKDGGSSGGAGSRLLEAGGKGEAVARRRDGSAFPASVSVGRGTGAARKPFYVLFVRDVTHEKAQEAELEAANRRTDDLLRNVLPGPIAERLKRGEERPADLLDDCTVLFADICSFCSMSSKMTPASDHPAAGSWPEAPPRRAQMVEFGLAMLSTIEQINAEHKTELRMRVGINTGSVIAGVLGRQRLAYDLWGKYY
eukprot:tig00021013_g17047.t1